LCCSACKPRPITAPRRVKPPQSPEASNPEIVGGILADESRHLFERWLERNKGTEQSRFVEQLLTLT
jgi:hypothetical protein